MLVIGGFVGLVCNKVLKMERYVYFCGGLLGDCMWVMCSVLWMGVFGFVWS